MRRLSLPCLVTVIVVVAGCSGEVAIVPPAGCANQVLDGSESDVDCGGSCASACAEGKLCKEAKDCVTGACVAGRCVAAAAPVGLSVEPWTGPVAGGSAVTITGTGFAGALEVRFGIGKATDVVVVSATSVTLKTPPGVAGPVDVTVAAENGASSTMAGAYVYADSQGSLALEQVLPASGLTMGGARGLLVGAGFDPAAKLYFGGVAATAVRTVDAKRIVFTTPPNRAGKVDVLVVNPGAVAARLARAFEYFAALGPAPTLAGILPSRLPEGSDATLEATGAHLGEGSLVFVGDAPVEVKVAGDGSVTFVLPAGFSPGVYDVTITTKEGQSVTLAAALEVLAAACDDEVPNATETDLDCGGSCPKPCADTLKCKLPEDCASRVCSGGRCAVSTCDDKAKNGQESDVDCGATCPPCADLLHCRAETDCVSGVCDQGVCAVPACNDEVKNGKESDQDCGSACPACADGLVCVVPGDCRSGVCASFRCAIPACNDLVRNGDETDNDCGGACPGCNDGKRCVGENDCLSGVCTGGLCIAPACDDLVKNGPESGVDCGATCPKCGVGQGCRREADCTSGVCTDGLCAAPSCTDAVKNGNETGLNCGGGTCPKCADLLGCVGPGDCMSGVCTGNVCQPASCTDGVKNGNETGLNCGGGTCPKCADLQGCGGPGDCTSGVCTDNVCQPASCTDGVKNGNETGLNCGGGTCPKCADGIACGGASDCVSGVCTGNLCKAASCTDGVKNGSETAIDCDGGCSPCAIDATVSSSVNLSAASLVPGRTCADAASFPVISLTATVATLSTAPGACLLPGDEVLLINLQGTQAAAVNAGAYELLPVASVTGSEVTFGRPKARSYGTAADNDLGLGTAAGDQHVALVRVPRYRNLTIASGATVTVGAWNGTLGGVLALAATTLQVDGTITVKAKGYRDGAWSTDGSCSTNVTTGQGESYTGPGTPSTAANGGGGGGIGALNGVAFNSNTPIAASAGHAASGQAGVNPNGRTLGGPGATYGSNAGDRLTMGSGVGGNLTCTGGGGAAVLQSTRNASAGGALLLNVTTLAVGSGGRIEADAGPSGRDGAPSGGTVVIRGSVLNLGTSRVTASGATAVSGSPPTASAVVRGSDGYVVVHYTTSVAGTTSPAATVRQIPNL